MSDQSHTDKRSSGDTASGATAASLIQGMGDATSSIARALRDILIVMLFIFVFLFPSSVKDKLIQAGVNYVKTDWIGWENLQKTGDDFQKAQQQISDLSAEIAKLKSAISTAAAAAPANPQIQSALVTATQIEQRALQAEQVIESGIQRNSAALTAAAMQSGEAGQWIVVVGADRSRRAAEDEVSRAKQSGYSGVQVVLRDGWYATVIPFPNAQAATASIPQLGTIFKDRSGAPRSGLRLRNLDSWCPKGSPSVADGLPILACQTAS